MDLPLHHMQTPEPPAAFDLSHHSSSHHLDRTSVHSPANRLGFPSVYAQHCAPAANAAFERHAGRAMHILALPPPTSLPPTPFGRRQEPAGGLAKLHPQFSPARSEQYSYPSPPMSDSHSPARRPAHLVQPEAHPYPHPVSDVRRLEALPPPPPPPPPFDHRSVTSAQSLQHQRPLYQGEASLRGPPIQYQSGPPPYGNMQIAPNYAYGYPGPGVPSFVGNPGPGPQVQPAAMIAPPPLRPNKPARRTKAHVASACVNCKKAHLSCDVQRPCGRCVASGKQDTCKDVQHKKRGRPRLRDDKEFGRGEEGRQAHTHLLGPLPPSVPTQDAFGQQSAFSSSHRATDPLRVLGRPDREPQGIPIQPQPHAQRISGNYGGVSSPAYGPGPSLANQSLPVAYLDLDLVIIKSNQAFQDLVAFLGDIRGKNLAELLETRSTDVLHRVRNELRTERDEREPAYMAPITPVGQNDPVHSVLEEDVNQVSQGFTNRSFLINFRLPNGQHQSLQTQIRLAKASIYFVSLVVHTPPRPAGPSLLTQQLAPPTPVGASQSLSAPTTAPVREFAPYPRRPSSSTSSAPTSPYFNFNSVRTSLPGMSASSYGSSPSYNYSPTAGAEPSYFPTIQPPRQPAPYPSPYPPVSRTGSVNSEASIRQEPPRETMNRPGRLEGLQLPPIRTGPVLPLHSPRSQDFTRVRPRESPLSGASERPDTPDTGKRRRLNIHEVLE